MVSPWYYMHMRLYRIGKTWSGRIGLDRIDLGPGSFGKHQFYVVNGQQFFICRSDGSFYMYYIFFNMMTIQSWTSLKTVHTILRQFLFELLRLVHLLVLHLYRSSNMKMNAKWFACDLNCDRPDKIFLIEIHKMKFDFYVYEHSCITGLFSDIILNLPMY